MNAHAQPIDNTSAQTPQRAAGEPSRAKDGRISYCPLCGAEYIERTWFDPSYCLRCHHSFLGG